MARARRAKAHPLRIVAPIVLALLLLGGVVFAVERPWKGTDTAAPASNPTVLASQQTAAPSTQASGSVTARSTRASAPSRTASSSPRAPSSDVGAAQKMADGCRAKVRAADAVLTAAKVGVGHWSNHVQAQTDADDGTISTKQRAAIFRRTRLDGPDDVRRYAQAVRSYRQQEGSCETESDTPAAVSSKLTGCKDRSRAQQPVLDAAEKGMHDWTSHLAAMRRSRMGHVQYAQELWIRAWRAAPPHLSAFRKGVAGYQPPAC